MTHLHEFSEVLASKTPTAISLNLGGSGGWWGPCPNREILETIVISVVFGKVEGDRDPCLTPKIMGNILIPIVSLRGGR